MIQHVYERASGSGAEQVVVATDDQRIADAVQAFSGDVCMTAPSHTSGTDRIAEVAALRRWSAETIVVNLQGDEPLMPPVLLREVADVLRDHPAAAVSTLAVPMHEPEQLFDPNAVKVVMDRAGYALYFSRAPIPWRRNCFDLSVKPQAHWLDGMHRHLGIYAYRVGFLLDYTELKPAPIEAMESLEQLRVLWHGRRIAVGIASEVPPAGVDTAADLARITQSVSD